MNLRLLAIISNLLFYTCVKAQAEIIFKNGMESIVYPLQLNDTGITFAGEYPSGNNADCTSTTTASPQDCHTGRDFTHNDDSDGHAGFSFTKLDAAGIPLVDQTVDYATTPWSCIKDNVTGLVWEIKTTTAGIHNKDNTYRWGGLTAIGRDHPNRQGTYYDDWNTLVQGTNTETLCGYNNWRVPTVIELSSIVNKNTFNPAIDLNFFPNTVSNTFWSSSPFVNFPNYAWSVSFNDSGVSGNFRDQLSHVFLTHSGQ